MMTLAYKGQCFFNKCLCKFIRWVCDNVPGKGPVTLQEINASFAISPVNKISGFYKVASLFKNLG